MKASAFFPLYEVENPNEPEASRAYRVKYIGQLTQKSAEPVIDTRKKLL